MKNFYLEATPKTPKLNFNRENGMFEISGRSIPENSIEFYKPLLDWLDEYVETPNQETNMVVKLEYFNTSSSKCLVEIFRRLEKIHKDGSRAKIKWFYDEEDEDMQESGEDFKEIIKLPIEMIMIKEDE
jgi:hypothetical protein